MVEIEDVFIGVKARIERALNGLLQANLIGYEIDGEWISIFSKNGRSDISVIPIEAMIKEGFYLLNVSIKENRPIVRFTTYKV